MIIAYWLVTLLEFLEFLTSPLGLAIGLWLNCYYVAVQFLEFDILLAALLPAYLALELYCYLNESV